MPTQQKSYEYTSQEFSKVLITMNIWLNTEETVYRLGKDPQNK